MLPLLNIADIAGFIFTKVLQELVKHWRNLGIFVVLFLDDGATTASNENLALSHSYQIKNGLLSAGWIPNTKKSHWAPVQILAWLGFWYNLIKGIIYASTDKLQSTLDVLQLILDIAVLPVRLLARGVGKLTSLQLSHSDVVYLHTRHMQRLIASANDWEQTVVLTDFCRDEIVFWQNYLIKGNGTMYVIDGLSCY